MLWWIAVAILVTCVVVGTERRLTRYLAVDQFGYLTFAEDLRHGRLFHRWPPIEALDGLVHPPIDVLAQTYVYDGHRVYSRYAPGFPLLLAGWGVAFGQDAAPYLGAVVLVGLCAVLLALGTASLGSRWGALIAVALVLLCQTFVPLWATTILRDLPAHCFALGGLVLLLRHAAFPSLPKLVVAGGALGFAAAIRPDAALYLLPAALIVLHAWRVGGSPWRSLAGQGVVLAGGIVLGLLPLLAYNGVATGNPLLPAQAIEATDFLTPSPSRPGYRGVFHGGTSAPVSGGGLRLANLREVLPANLGLVRLAFGDVGLGLAILGTLAAVRRPLLLFATVPYVGSALLLYSCWLHPDPRYLVGVFLLLPLLAANGVRAALDGGALVGRGGPVLRWTVATLASAATAAAALSSLPALWGSLQAAPRLVGLGTGCAAVAVAARVPERICRAALPLLACGLVGMLLLRTAGETRARFQDNEVRRAQASVAAAVEAGAVIITTEDVGRPAENIEYYSGVASAFYLTDLQRWRVTLRDAADALVRAGHVPYLLLPPATPGLVGMLDDLAPSFVVERVLDIPPARAVEFFVASPFHRGVPLVLLRLRSRPVEVGRGPP